MRRTIFLVLSILLLGSFLSGCAQFVPTEQESRTPVFQPTPTPVQTEPPASPTEGGAAPGADSGGSSDLSHVLTFTEFPEGNYLADPKFDTDEFLPDYDIDAGFLQSGSSRLGLCATDSTIYFFPRQADSYASSFLYFTDIASGVTMPLCSKPECSHTDNTCNAYLAGNSDVYGLRIYEGKLYWLAYNGSAIQVMRMNLDGTGRETVTSLDHDISIKGIQNVQSVTWIIHRGYVYVAGVTKYAQSIVEPGEYFVYAKPLDEGEGFTIVSGTVECSVPFCLINPVGNELYIAIQYYQMTGEELNITYTMGAFYRWNSKTRKGEYLYGQETAGEECLTSFSHNNMFPRNGDGLYYCIYANQGNDTITKSMKLSFQTGTLEEVANPELHMTPTFARDCIVCQSGSRIRIYDYDFNLLFENIPDERYSLSAEIAVNSQFVFCQYEIGRYIAIAAVPRDGGETMILRGPIVANKPARGE